MSVQVIEVEMTDCAATHDAVALIAPLGIDTEFQRFRELQAPAGWGVSIVAEPRSGQRAAVLEPTDRSARACVRQTFASAVGALPEEAYVPEGSPLSIAAQDLAQEARGIATAVGGGLAGIAAIVEDTSARFDYATSQSKDRWYLGHDAVPLVACAAGDCVDINTYLVAALRAAGYETSYITCYFFDDNPNGIASGMHCWVRTRFDGCVQDWDIAHVKKDGRSDVRSMLNPIPGRRFALAYGRDHAYPWRGIDIRIPTPSRPMWVLKDGSTVWGAPPRVRLL